MFLLYHSEGCDIYGTVFYGCHVNDYSVLHMQWYAGSPQLVSEKIALTLGWKPSKWVEPVGHILAIIKSSLVI